MISGTPSDHTDFGEKLREPITEELWSAYRGAGRGVAEERFNDRLQALRPTWQDMADAEDAGHVTLTLIDAELWPLAGGDGLALAALRVPLGAVTAWWSGSARRLSAPREMVFGFGVIAPIGE